MSNDKAKQAAGYKAAELVEDGMKVGLGTGSTAYFFIEKLIERCKSGLKIEAIATSKKSSDQAKAGGIKLIPCDQLEYLDIDVDGADEINLQKQMIKGGGGALFREKIIACSAREMIVIVSEDKIVEKLGEHALPIEITSYGYPSIIEKLRRLDVVGEIRKDKEKFYVTDNGNLILDANMKNYSGDFRELDTKIIKIPGVIETGLFWNLAGRVVIGYNDGRAEIKGAL
ncbi:MAG: Ribose-5-phosphate isomerase A [Chlamydiae bacterium]|nr:Ribose-5-phosphate isomerase A [Chlamydiota bacterium]